MSDIYHVLPINDLVEHDTDGECICGPETVPVKRDEGSIGYVIVHHSLDGREQHETPRIQDCLPNGLIVTERRHRLCARRARKLRERLLARDGNACCFCHAPFNPVLDGTGHDGAPSIARMVAGTHAFEHLRLAHRACNRKTQTA